MVCAGVTTGVSAWDRATTIRALANPETQPTELVRPGHIFPLRYTAGGVLTRGGHTVRPRFSPCLHSLRLHKIRITTPSGCQSELLEAIRESEFMC